MQTNSLADLLDEVGAAVWWGEQVLPLPRAPGAPNTFALAAQLRGTRSSARCAVILFTDIDTTLLPMGLRRVPRDTEPLLPPRSALWDPGEGPPE